MEFLKDSRYEKIFESIIFLLCGITCASLAKLDITSMSYVLSGICCIVGIFYLCAYLLMIKDNNQAILSRAIILIIIFLVIVLFLDQFLQIYPIVIAIFLFYNAIQHFTFTLDIKEIKEHHWKVDLYFSILTFLAAISFIVLGAIEEIQIEDIIFISGLVYSVQAITTIILLWKVHPSYNKRTK